MNHNVYLPDEISERAKKAGINLSAALRSAVLEELEGGRPRLWCAWNGRSAFVLVIATTREEAIDKARAEAKRHAGNYVPAQQRMEEVDFDHIEVVESGAWAETGLR